MNCRILMAAGLAACVGSASAFPTGLNLMPVADVLGHREALAQYLAYGYERGIDPRYYHSQGVTVGLYDRFEFGYDNDFLGTTILNAKFQVVSAEDHAVSVGVQNWEGTHAEPYVVGRKDFGDLRVHAGWIQDPTNRLMLGVDFPVFGGATGMVDFVSGDGGSLWAGVYFEIKQLPGVAVTTSVGLPNNRSEGIQHYLYISYGFKL